MTEPRALRTAPAVDTGYWYGVRLLGLLAAATILGLLAIAGAGFAACWLVIHALRLLFTVALAVWP